MSNQDYKQRLKEMESDFDPGAWSKMDQLLDQIENKNDKPKFSFFKWGALLSLLFVGIVFLIWQTSNFNNIDDGELDTTKVLETEKQALVTDQDLLLDTEKLTGVTKEESDLESALTDHNPSTQRHNNTTIRNGITSTNQKSTSRSDRASESNKNLPVVLTSEELGSKDSKVALDNKGLNKNSIMGIYPIKNNAETDQTYGLDINKSAPSIKETLDKKTQTLVGENSLEQNLLTEIQSIIKRNKFLKQEQRILDVHSPVLLKPQKLFMTIDLGPARFNSNPGIKTSLGMFYDASKLIGVEIGTSYSYGQERDIYEYKPEIRTFEQQFDLNFITHLKLIQVAQHRFSFQLGIGYTFYNGDRRINTVPDIQVDTRKSNGISYNGGIEYTYLYSKRTHVGIKCGAIIYDDAVDFLTFRLYRTF